jgi:hypothetical protein
VGWWEKSSKNGYFCSKMQFFSPKMPFLVIFAQNAKMPKSFSIHFSVDKPRVKKGKNFL